jgi:Uma2 family endonuclease
MARSPSTSADHWQRRAPASGMRPLRRASDVKSKTCDWHRWCSVPRYHEGGRMETPTNKTWTYDDLLALPDDGTRYEIIDGELVVMSSPLVTHQRVLQRLFIAFHRQVQETGQGEVFIAPLDVIMAPTRVVQPDLVVVKHDNDIIREKIRGIPDLMIEVLSPSNHKYDLVIKRRFYARNRVPEYWMIDPEAQTVEVLALVEGGLSYHQHGWYGPGDVARSATFKIELPVDDLFQA